MSKVQKLETPNKAKPSDLQPQGFFSARFDLKMKDQFTKDDLTDSRFWQLVNGKIRPGDEIRVLSEDMTTRADVIVTYKNGPDVKVEVINFHQFDVEQSDYEESSDYKVCHQGNGRYGVKHLATGEYVVGDLKKSDAYKALEEHLRALAS